MIVFVEKNKVVSSVYFTKGDKNYIDFEIGGMENYTPVKYSLFSIDKKLYHNGSIILQIIHPQEKIPKLPQLLRRKKK